VISKDPELSALAALAGLATTQAPAQGALVDLRQLRDPQRLQGLLLDALRESLQITLDFADGARWQLRAVATLAPSGGRRNLPEACIAVPMGAGARFRGGCDTGWQN
jgi:hypothetical protein